MGGHIRHLMADEPRGTSDTISRRVCLIWPPHPAYSNEREAAGVRYRREREARHQRGIALRAAQAERRAYTAARRATPVTSPFHPWFKKQEKRRRLIAAQAQINAEAETEAAEALARGQPDPPQSRFPRPNPKWAAGEPIKTSPELLPPPSRPSPRSDFRRSHAREDAMREARERADARAHATLAEERANNRALSRFRSRLSSRQIAAGIDQDLPADSIALHERLFGWRHSRGYR